MNKLLLNTQIASILKDDAPKIVQFYKEHGFDTTGYQGLVYRAEFANIRFYFYGVNNFGKFDNRSEYSELKTITLEEAKELVKEKVLFTIKDLTEGKCCVENDGTQNELRTVLNTAKADSGKDYSANSKYYWTHTDYYWYNGNNVKTSKVPTQSVKDFLKQININMKKEVTRFPFLLNCKDAQKIINIACDAWKDKLATKWSIAIVLTNNITITELDYKTMRDACNHDQNVLFDEIFGKDVPDNSVDLSKPGMKDTLISIRSYEEYKNKGFYLDSSYTWEIVTDSAREKVLVPTKK